MMSVLLCNSLGAEPEIKTGVGDYGRQSFGTRG